MWWALSSSVWTVQNKTYSGNSYVCFSRIVSDIPDPWKEQQKESTINVHVSMNSTFFPLSLLVLWKAHPSRSTCHIEKIICLVLQFLTVSEPPESKHFSPSSLYLQFLDTWMTCSESQVGKCYKCEGLPFLFTPTHHYLLPIPFLLLGSWAFCFNFLTEGMIMQVLKEKPLSLEVGYHKSRCRRQRFWRIQNK